MIPDKNDTTVAPVCKGVFLKKLKMNLQRMSAALFRAP